MTNLVIQGHTTRGKEVIEILEMLGGNNPYNYSADSDSLCFYIGKNTNTIYRDWGNNCYEDKDIFVFTLEQFEEKFPYKVGDKVQRKGATSCSSVYEIESLRWKDNRVEYVVYILGNGARLTFTAEDLRPFEEETMETNTHKGYCTTDEETKNKSKKAAWFTFWDNDFADKVELDLSNRELIQEDGKWFVVKKKKEYPKTYKECCEVLGIEEDLWFVYEDIDGNHINPACISNYRMRRLDLYHNLEKLIICRDAYWKIAGDEMGLGKPWEPSANEEGKTHALYYNRYTDSFDKCSGIFESNAILDFPTKEMRDDFFENFKRTIETVKELL